MELTIKKGYDLPLEGAVTDLSPQTVSVDRIAVYPDDFPGFEPKLAVKPGEHVMYGDAIFFEKKHPELKITSPICGYVESIERGERRHIDRIIIKRDDKEEFKIFDVKYKNAEEALALLCDTGMLALIRQRPFDIVPAPDVRPRSIFVTGIDSAPLAVDPVWTIDDGESLQAAAELFNVIAKDKVYLSRRASSMIPNLKGVENVSVSGPHPAGLAGIQAANIAPVSKGEVIWTMSISTMIRIGRLLQNRKINSIVTVAITGSCVKSRGLIRTFVGAPIEDVLRGRLDESKNNVRIISGNVLTGKKVSPDGYLRYPYTQVTVIPEGDDKDEFMGWASMSPQKMSISPTFPGKFLHKLFNPDARINGGRRAIIMSGEYDRVLPMDIYGEYLIKAIKAKDIDAMERLGIYEVAPEDFALAEALDSSKQPLQAIVRSGLDFLRKELE